ncbi:DNA/RNA non-specific endonuclease [Saccharomonospora azurea]
MPLGGGIGVAVGGGVAAAKAAAQAAYQAWLQARRQRVIDDVNTPHARPPKTDTIVDSIRKAIDAAKRTIIDLGVIDPSIGDESYDRYVPDAMMETSPPVTSAHPPDDEYKEECLTGGMKSDVQYWPMDHSIKDPRGRATGAYACYSGYLPKKGGGARYTPAGFVDNQGMSRAHLIARTLGGSNQDPRNFVAFSMHANRYMYSNKQNRESTEAWIEKRVKSGDTLFYQVVPSYLGKNPVPHHIDITVESRSGHFRSFSLLNIRRDGHRFGSVYVR